MTTFMDKDFLLNTETARKLYHDYAASCPIIDYHCHISPKEIWEDQRFENITKVWLGGDHYKWRLMRCAGVDEYYITGGASDYEKFCKWAEVVGKAIGNPLYHWTHLELQRFFGYHGTLSAKTADEVWNLANETLQKPGYTTRGLIAMSNVETICTTDDPVDTLEYHQKLLADKSFKTNVLPAWRPDKAVNIEKPDFMAYIAKLEKAAEMEIHTFADLKAALEKRMAYFHENNCRLSDHAQAVTFSLCRSTHDDRTVQHKKGRSGGLCRLFCRTDARHDGGVGQAVQCSLAFRGGKGAVSQQTAVQRAVRAEDLPAEPRRQLRQQRRAGQQDFPAELVGVGQRHAVGGKYRRDRGLAAAAAPRDA